MQISFSHTHNYVPEWRGNNTLPAGEQFSVTLTVMNVSNLMFLIDSFSEAGIDGKVEVGDFGSDQLKPLVEKIGHLLPEHAEVVNLKNSETATDITIKEVVEYPYFLNLSVELLMKLSELSTPNDDDVGNSNAPPDSEASH